MTKTEKREFINKWFNIFWFISLIYLLFYCINSIFKESLKTDFGFVSLALLLLLKAVFNARYYYRKALKGNLIFGGKIADAMFVWRQFFKQRRVDRKKA